MLNGNDRPTRIMKVSSYTRGENTIVRNIGIFLTILHLFYYSSVSGNSKKRESLKFYE